MKNPQKTTTKKPTNQSDVDVFTTAGAQAEDVGLGERRQRHAGAFGQEGARRRSGGVVGDVRCRRGRRLGVAGRGVGAEQQPRVAAQERPRVAHPRRALHRPATGTSFFFFFSLPSPSAPAPFFFGMDRDQVQKGSPGLLKWPIVAVEKERSFF